MMRCGISLNYSGVWEIEQLFEHLQDIIVTPQKPPFHFPFNSSSFNLSFLVFFLILFFFSFLSVSSFTYFLLHEIHPLNVQISVL